MDINLFDYHLPEDRIAQYPARKRDESRLLVVHRSDGRVEHRRFFDIAEYIHAGDVLVLNNSKVIHARLIGTKISTGAVIELFLVGRIDRGEGDNTISRSGIFPAADDLWDEAGQADWEVLAKPAKRLKNGDIVTFGKGLNAEMLGANEDGGRIVRFRWTGSFAEQIERLGRVPLPPYIKRQAIGEDKLRYQTVYSEVPGSVAAPTAGLHFTTELIERLRQKGAEFAYVTLHVGLGTFLPVKTERVEDHVMHREAFHIGEAAARTIAAAKREGRRVVCVGTTSVRTVESAAKHSEHSGETDIFIYPGYEFRVTDGLLTNFHLPKSTLLMLVSAFYDREKVLKLYDEAVEEGYRFFSYGDAMLLV
ncbi:MAG: tRNA preQ1(34) S-adenosylmethionine ribosyltransferase-isomerase QueA [Clostridiales Family XIII bacterium]|jgi:S-adenosylmethionine:tRNA ribosyltransferase-isomerase|nr:tRNA preQ1(34) S-adenosylmethionine ribosyltransferase-isomerase QueA [Clostridiales Family XIII bacterium]